jgi:WS/DGAT/MGAT family acyltransferase
MSIDRLSPTDRLMLLADDAWPQEIGALAILDGDGGRLDVTDLRRRVASRLHLVPRLRQVIHRPGLGRGGPLWVDARRFDIAQHVRIAGIPAPGDEAALLDRVESLRRRRLDLGRPGWEMWLLTGLANGRVGLFVKIHHAMADGLAAMTMVSVFFDGAAADADPAGWRPAPAPRPSDLVADELRRHLGIVAGAVGTLRHPATAWRRIRGAIPATRELLADDPPPMTSLDRPVGLDRRLALLRCTVADLRRIARARHATTNDVLLALIAGGLRALLQARGENLERVWTPIYVPISMRRRWHRPIAGNRVAQMAIPLPLGITHPLDRLDRIAFATAAGKRRDRSAVGKLFRSSLTTWLVLAAVDRQRVNVCSANVPGPRRQLTLLGSPVTEIVPILPLIGRVGLGVGAVSYAGGFTIGVTADREMYPDLDVFVSGMAAELGTARDEGQANQPVMAETSAGGP